MNQPMRYDATLPAIYDAMLAKAYGAASDAMLAKAHENKSAA